MNLLIYLLYLLNVNRLRPNLDILMHIPVLRRSSLLDLLAKRNSVIRCRRHLCESQLQHTRTL